MSSKILFAAGHSRVSVAAIEATDAERIIDAFEHDGDTVQIAETPLGWRVDIITYGRLMSPAAARALFDSIASERESERMYGGTQ